MNLSLYGFDRGFDLRFGIYSGLRKIRCVLLVRVICRMDGLLLELVLIYLDGSTVRGWWRCNVYRLQIENYRWTWSDTWFNLFYTYFDAFNGNRECCGRCYFFRFHVNHFGNLKKRNTRWFFSVESLWNNFSFIIFIPVTGVEYSVIARGDKYSLPRGAPGWYPGGPYTSCTTDPSLKVLTCTTLSRWWSIP